MTEAERGDDAVVPTTTVGQRLRVAREVQGLTLAEVAARTRIPLRHLEAIETADYAGLPSATYAVGFVRAYARAVGADEVPLARDVRDEVSRTVRDTPKYQPYEIVDPARVPSRGMVIAAAGLALAILVLAILWFATGLLRGGNAPMSSTPPVVATVPAVATPTATPARGGQVTLTATDEVWLRVYDAADATLYLGTMKPGERFDVPANANDPMINVGRPDKLNVTVNGSAIPPLGTGERPIKDVKVGAAALAARLAAARAAQTPAAQAPAP